MPFAAIAQLGERQTEDLKVPGSIPGGGTVTALVAQSVEHGSNKPRVGGSSPSWSILPFLVHPSVTATRAAQRELILVL